MKIICTKDEQERLIINAIDGHNCIVTNIEKPCGSTCRKDCEECILKNIEWELEDEGRENELS